jgi:hypothetical protein
MKPIREIKFGPQIAEMRVRGTLSRPFESEEALRATIATPIHAKYADRMELYVFLANPPQYYAFLPRLMKNPRSTPMKVAELKRRLTPGVKLRLTDTLMGPTDKVRVVAKTNSVDVMFTGDNIDEGKFSHLPWPKASRLFATPDGFEIVEENGEVSARYKWED